MENGEGCRQVAIVKSLKMNVAVAEWDRLPLVPVIVTLKGVKNRNDPVEFEVHDNVAVEVVGGKVTLPDVRALHARP